MKPTSLPSHNSYWDARFKRKAIKLLPGEYVACNGKEMIVTVLGSCISVCLYESTLKIGGMNHFMLPAAKNSASNGDSVVYQNNNAARYGNVSMELLINEIIKLGGHRKNLQAKIFGGGSVTQSSIDIGNQNIDFIREYLKLENIPILSEDVGGVLPRKVYFVPELNDVYVKCIKKIRNGTIEHREKTYKETIDTENENNIFYL